ncbi:C1orf158 [Bugula neritina]|uniref:C1orf158 n=1 Tax=Bugula neritina TaxID=10212 RepID=A0A7J7KJT9_BUGNE|nr:C1orf158 [Bugula neritina]
MISLYDEYYNRRARPDGQKFPPVRSWDSKSMTWVPEKIDHPLQADPTNWGLKNEVAERQAKLEKEKNISDYLSTYSLGYTEKPVDVRVRRYATARDSSTKLHPVNKVNKNLNLRNATANPHMPQHLQIRSPYVI